MAATIARLLAVLRMSCDEGAVDLQLVDREALAGRRGSSSRCRSRRSRVARRAPSGACSVRERGRRCAASARVSVISSSSSRGGRPLSLAARARPSAASFGSLNWRADRLTATRICRPALAATALALRQASRSTQSPICTDQAGLLGDRDEVAPAAPGRAPGAASARSASAPIDLAAARVDDRLVVQRAARRAPSARRRSRLEREALERRAGSSAR